LHIRLSEIYRITNKMMMISHNGKSIMHPFLNHYQKIVEIKIILFTN